MDMLNESAGARRRIAYNGEPGAFADLAARSLYPDAVTVPFKSFKSAYRACEAGECDYALLPLENSYGGDVGQVMDLCFFGGLHMVGIHAEHIVQNLLALPGAELSDIRLVTSHPQALSQCQDFLEKHGFATKEAYSTSTAAKTVAESGDRSIAAIGSTAAAETFGLRILSPAIMDCGTNTTRFALLSREDRLTGTPEGHFVLLFTVKDSAGSLGEAVTVIGRRGFNLRSIRSRPTKELVWNYYFFAEGDGDIRSAEGKAMLDELSGCCKSVRVLGAF